MNELQEGLLLHSTLGKAWFSCGVSTAGESLQAGMGINAPSQTRALHQLGKGCSNSGCLPSTAPWAPAFCAKPWENALQSQCLRKICTQGKGEGFPAGRKQQKPQSWPQVFAPKCQLKFLSFSHQNFLPFLLFLNNLRTTF